MFKEQFA